jgi:hypothetical protein
MQHDFGDEDSAGRGEAHLQPGPFFALFDGGLQHAPQL